MNGQRWIFIRRRRRRRRRRQRGQGKKVPLPRPLGVAEYRKQMKCRTFCDFIEERTEFLRCVSFFLVVSFWCVVLFCCCCCCCCSAFLSELLPGLLSSVTEFYWVSMEWNLVKGRYRVLPGLCSVFRLITDSILGFDGIEFGKGRLPSFTEFVIECFRAITEFYWVLMEWNLGKDCYRVLPCL